MFRLNTRFWLIVPVLMLAVITVACGVGGEEKTLLSKYFQASKVADNLTLQNIATIAFDPKVDGQMQTFSILSVTEPKTSALELKANAAALKTVVGEEKAFTERKKKYQDDNSAAIDRILTAERKKQPLRGKDAEIQKEWNKFLEEQAVISGKLSDARRKANAGRGLVEISCQDQRNPIDVTAYEGEMLSKDVTIEGKVKPETGDAVTKKFIITMQQATLKGVNGKDNTGRWVITARKEMQ